MSAPAFKPPHKLPVWLSSADVLEAIRELADRGVDKAACWDFTQAVYTLSKARGESPSTQGADDVK